MWLMGLKQHLAVAKVTLHALSMCFANLRHALEFVQMLLFLSFSMLVFGQSVISCQVSMHIFLLIQFPFLIFQ